MILNIRVDVEVQRLYSNAAVMAVKENLILNTFFSFSGGPRALSAPRLGGVYKLNLDIFNATRA